MADSSTSGGRCDMSLAVGLMIEDAAAKPPKPPATEAQILAAGVRPDRIRSAVRQQINGYVVDAIGRQYVIAHEGLKLGAAARGGATRDRVPAEAAPHRP
jgi:hypothetical protein